MTHFIRAAYPSLRAMEIRAAKQHRPAPEVPPSGRSLPEDLEKLRLSLLTGKR